MWDSSDLVRLNRADCVINGAEAHSCTGACAHRCTGRCSMNVNARWSQNLTLVCKRQKEKYCRSSASSDGSEPDQTGGWCVFHPFFPSSPRRSTHRHCGLSDCAAGCLPDLRRAPRFQQVLGESPGGFGCHLLIGAIPEHRFTAAASPRSPLLKWATVYRRARTHTDTHAHTHTHESLHTLSRPPGARQPSLW